MLLCEALHAYRWTMFIDNAQCIKQDKTNEILSLRPLQTFTLMRETKWNIFMHATEIKEDIYLI